MQLTLRSIHHSKRFSEETPCYDAQVWVDGVHVCDVKNDGHGGPDYQYPAKGKTRADVDALNARCKAELPKWTYEADGATVENDTDLEMACHLKLDEVELLRTVIRDLGAKIMFLKPDGKIYQISKKKFRSVDDVVAKIAALRDAGNKVLNEMPVEESVAVYRKVFG